MDVPPAMGPIRSGGETPAGGSSFEIVRILDKLCAGLMVGFSALTALAAAGFYFAAASASPGQVGMRGRFDVGAAQPTQELLRVMFVVLLIGTPIQILCAGGLWKQRRWAYAAAIPTYLLFMLAWAASLTAAIVSAAIAMYCALRLTGRVGPSPGVNGPRDSSHSS